VKHVTVKTNVINFSNLKIKIYIMKIIALIPFWMDYKPLRKSLACRPLVKVSGKSLINRTIEIINHIKLIDKTVIFTSDSEVCGHIDDNMNYEIVQRDSNLNSDSASIEGIINEFLQVSDADIVVLIHPKSPFIRPQTIGECIEKVLAGGFDSAFIANSIKRQAWYKGKPLNYLIDKDTPMLSELEPVLIESSSIYVFTRALFKKSRHRIGKNPYIKEVGHFEGFEVDNKDDLTMAELMINAGLDKEF
jgi:CMP-N-acetylneuraminic acid synthetase